MAGVPSAVNLLKTKQQNIDKVTQQSADQCSMRKRHRINHENENP